MTQRADPSGPCYFGVWFGSSYTVCAGYDFKAQKFVIGKNDLSFGSSLSRPYASKSYSWTKTSNGKYPAHRFAFTLIGNKATIYLDGVQVLTSTNSAFASSGDILLMYSKGEAVIDNVAVSNADYNVATDTGATVMKVDFESGTASLAGWTLGGYITTDIREFDMRDYLPESHVHTNELVASHEATYFHGAYEEYECSACHLRTVVETGAALSDGALVYVAALGATCTANGNIEYWYGRDGRRYSDAAGNNEIAAASVGIAALGHELVYHPAIHASAPEDGFIEYWTCSRCLRSYADANAATEIDLTKSAATREVEREIGAIGTVKYREESQVNGSGIVGTFTTGEGNSNYSVLDVGNSGQKLNADYTLEMTIRIRDVDLETQIGGASGAFFGLYCENFTVGYDFATERWGISPTAGLFASYAFHPSETGTMCVLCDSYFHTVTIECTTGAIRVFVDGSSVLSASSLVRENNRYSIFYPRLCTVEFASYAFKYNGTWVNDHLTGAAIVSASTWTSRGSAYATTAETFTGSTLADSLRAIENAERMYGELSANEKLLVSNYAQLVRARTMYDLLASGGEGVRGDVDLDGSVNAADVIKIMRYLVGFDQPEFFVRFADYDGDGKVNARDVLTLMLALVNGD